MAPLGEMPNPERIKAHQSCAGCLCRDRIIGKYNLAQLAGASLKRSVAFHCGNTVSDHEVDRNGRTDVEDAFVNSAPCSRFFGQPYFMPGTIPNMFFKLSVTPAQ